MENIEKLGFSVIFMIEIKEPHAQTSEEALATARRELNEKLNSGSATFTYQTIDLTAESEIHNKLDKLNKEKEKRNNLWYMKFLHFIRLV